MPMLRPLIRFLSVLALLFCLSAPAEAQRVQRIGFSVGTAAPIGDFKRDRFEDDYPPLARTGANWQLNYRTDLKPYLAIGATTGFRSHRFDIETFAGPDDGLVLRKEASGWRSAHLLGDLYLQSTPDILFGYLKGSLGVSYNQAPEVLVETRFGPVRRSSDTALAPVYGIASGFGVQDGRFLLSFEIGVLRTRPEFDIQDAKGASTTVKQDMHFISYSMGLSYTL